MAATSKKVRFFYFLFFLAAFIIVLPALFLYATGYSIDEAFNLTRRGGVYLYVSESDVDVFIGDNFHTKTSLFEREVFVKNLEAGRHLVLVSHNDFWPWAKFVEVESGEVAARFPLLVPKVMQFRELSKNSVEYSSASKLFLNPNSANSANSAKVLAANPNLTATSTDEKLKIFAVGARVQAEWLEATSTIPYYFCGPEDINLRQNCLKNITIFSGTSNIETLNFYPGRDDAIMLTLGNGIYAAEIDSSPYHNVYPIFRGQNPDLRIDGRTIYVKDNDYIATAEI